MYNEGMSLSDIADTKLISAGSLLRGGKAGLIKFINEKSVLAKRCKHKRCKPLTKEHKEKISETILNKSRNGNWHSSFKKTRRIKFNSKFAGEVVLLGSWELAYANYLETNNIPWRRPTECFKYNFNKLKKGYGFYTPDFFLINDKIWIEIKGYQTDKDTAKWKDFPFPNQLKILREKDLKALNLI